MYCMCYVVSLCITLSFYSSFATPFVLYMLYMFNVFSTDSIKYKTMYLGDIFMSGDKKLVKDSIYMLATNVYGKGLLFLSNIVLARLLPVSEYGRYTLLFAIVTILSYIPVFGLNDGLKKYVPQLKVNQNIKELKYLVGFTLYFVLFFSFITIILAHLITKNFFVDMNLGTEFQVFLIFILFNSMFIVLTSLLQAHKRYYHYGFALNIVEPSIFIGSILLLQILSFEDIYIGIYSKLLAGLIACVYVLIVSYKKGYFSLKVVYVSQFSKMIKFSIKIFLTTITGLIMARINTIIIAYFLTNREVAFYNVSFQIAFIISFFLLSLEQVIVPIISEKYAANKIKELQNLYGKVTLLLSILSIFIVLILTLFSKTILGFFGEEYLEANSVFIIIVIGQVVNAISGPCGYMLTMMGHPNINLNLNILMVTFGTLLSIILINFFGLIGAAIANLFMISFINLFRMKKLYDIHGMIPFKVN
jgi:O-antigen/teichoic acid export membrane protein